MSIYVRRRILVAAVALGFVALVVFLLWPGGGREPEVRPAGSWVAEENGREGSDAWQVGRFDLANGVHGYADRTSAQQGETFDLMVSTKAPSFRVEAYRVGHYGGKRGRLVWESGDVEGREQGDGDRDAATNMIEMGWEPSLQVDVGEDWPPGVYLLKLVASDGTESWVPLVVRDDASDSGIAVLVEFTTWQAYNKWGGCSLYECPGVKGEKRATVVSFDRPYAYGNGAADFFGLELPLIDLAEGMGLDLAYFSLLDVERDPHLLAGRTAVLSLGHDEYYSPNMRDAIDEALTGGANLAFFGANAMYRNIRFEDGADGSPMRRMVNYRDSSDPIHDTDPAKTTTQWRAPPLSRPEGEVVGIQYECAPLQGDVVVVDAASWVFAGTGAENGTRLVGILGEEYDRWFSGVSPENLQILAHSPARCRGRSSFADMSYYSAPSGGGVFATGTNRWIPGIDGSTPTASTPETRDIVRGATQNVLREFAQPRAGERLRSEPNATAFWD